MVSDAETRSNAYAGTMQNGVGDVRDESEAWSAGAAGEGYLYEMKKRAEAEVKGPN